jgi:hypothetical protein
MNGYISIQQHVIGFFNGGSVCLLRGTSWPFRTPLDSFLVAFAKLRNATISFFMSVCLSAWNNSASTGQILMKLDI